VVDSLVDSLIHTAEGLRRKQASLWSPPQLLLKLLCRLQASQACSCAASAHKAPLCVERPLSKGPSQVLQCGLLHGVSPAHRVPPSWNGLCCSVPPNASKSASGTT
jgi:hypothetical protein